MIVNQWRIENGERWGRVERARAQVFLQFWCFSFIRGIRDASAKDFSMYTVAMIRTVGSAVIHSVLNCSTVQYCTVPALYWLCLVLGLTTRTKRGFGAGTSISSNTHTHCLCPNPNKLIQLHTHHHGSSSEIQRQRRHALDASRK